MTKLMKCLLLIGACCLAHVKFALAGHVCDDKKLHTNNVNCGADEDETLVSSSGCGAFWNSACYDCCKKHGLTYDYYVGSWGSCSATCGGGTQTRTVQCQSGTSSSTAAADGACAGKTKPSTSQSCNTQECVCAPGCKLSWKADGECDMSCVNAACNYDSGDCKYCDVSGSTRDDVDGRYYKYGSQTCDSKPVYYKENNSERYLYLNTNSNWMFSTKESMETCGSSGFAHSFGGTADYPHWTGLNWKVSHSSTWLEVPNLRVSCPGEPTRPASYTYSYTTGSWSSCSASCGGGTSTRSVTCKRSDGQSVSDSSCSGSKPSTSQSCNTGACATTTTTTTITFNEDGCDNKKLHTNNVNCGADEEETLVSSSGCGAFWASACYDCCKKQEAGEATPTPAPTTTTEAQTTSAITTNPAKAPTTSPTTGSYTYAFSEGSFGSCSETCGGGTRTRSVTCLRSDGQAVADTMCTSTKPSTSQSCNSQPCTTATTTPVVAATLQLPAKTSQAWQGTLLGALCAVAALVVVG